MKKTLLLFVLSCILFLAIGAVSADGELIFDFCDGSGMASGTGACNVTVNKEVYDGDAEGEIPENQVVVIKNYTGRDFLINDSSGAMIDGIADEVEQPYVYSVLTYYRIFWDDSIIVFSNEPIPDPTPVPQSEGATAAIPVIIYPEDEFGAYHFNEDGKKEYNWFLNYGICMRFMGSESACANYQH